VGASPLLVVSAVPEERARMTLAAAAVDVDDSVVDPSNGDCTAVSFRPAATASAGAEADPSQLVRRASGDSTTRREAVAALSSGDAPRPAAEVSSAAASSAAEEEERELFVYFFQYVMLWIFSASTPLVEWQEGHQPRN